MKCAYPHCRQEHDMQYVGAPLCADHWRELARSDPATELELLAKISLTRNEATEVVEA